MALTSTQRIASTSGGAFGTGAYTSGAFTPSNSSRLVVWGWAIQEADGGMRGTDLVISDSLGGSWTPHVLTTASPAWSYGIGAWSRAITTGASMTVSIDTDASNFDMEFYRLEIHDYTTNVGGASVGIGATALGSDADGDGAASITLSGAPATSSIVIGACLTGLGSASGTITQGSGFTERLEAVMASWAVCQSQSRTGSTSTTVDWADVLATGTGFGGATLGALEITEVGGAAQRVPMIDARHFDFHI